MKNSGSRRKLEGLEDLITWRGAGLPAVVYCFLMRHLPLVRGRTRFLMVVSRLFFRDRIRLKNRAGISIVVDPIDYIGELIVTKGEFEPHSLRLCARLLDGGGVFFDVGANFGLYSLTMGAIPGVRCVALDPLPQAVARLTEHRSMNLSLDLQVFAAPMSGRSGLVIMAPPVAGNFGTGRVVTESRADGIWVHSVSFQQVFAATNFTRVDVMKMDVEGHEVEALGGVDFDADSCPQHLILEQEQAVASEERFSVIWDLLQSKGYEAYDVLGKRLARGDRPVENNVWWTRRRGALVD